MTVTNDVYVATHLSREQALRLNAVHEASTFLTFRMKQGVAAEPPRLAEVADVAYRMEHYLRTGEFPLAEDWKRPDYTLDSEEDG